MTRGKTIGALVTLLAATAGMVGPATAEILIKIADRYPVSHYISEGATKFWMDAVRKATNDEVRFQHYPAEQLGKSKDMLTLTLSGVTDVGEIVPAYVSEKLPLSTVGELPGAFSTSCQGSLAVYELTQPGGYLYEKEFAPAGLRPLIALTPVPYQIFTREVFTELSGIAGLKLRSSGGGMDLVARRLAAVPIRLSAAETYEALSRKTVDGTIFPTASMTAYDLGGFTKAGTSGANFGSAVIVYAISERKWQQLPPHIQAAMTKAGEQATRNVCARSQSEDQTSALKLESGGTRLVKLSDGDLEKLKQAAEPAAEDWAASLEKKGKPGTETLKQFREAVSRQPGQ
jgi:TRAP-type C4-dicarboxylate transport system substrate-binding protein